MLAIVIPFYKIKYFEQTLDSLVRQTDQRFNVYIGDDNSPDNVKGLLEKFENIINLNYVKFDSNFGGNDLAKQWKRCIELSNNESWFVLLGDDDYLSVNFVATFYEHLNEIENNNINVVKFKSITVDECSNELIIKNDVTTIKSAWEHFFDKFVHEGRSSLSEHIFRKESYRKNEFKSMPLAWHSDDLALLEFSEYGNIYYVSDSYVYVRFSLDNISGQQESLDVKRKASAFFYNYLLVNMRNYNHEFLIKFLHLIEWAQKDKGFNAAFWPLIKKYFEAYGVKGIIRLIKYKILK